MINKKNILYFFVSIFLLTLFLVSIKIFNLSINIINFTSVTSDFFVLINIVDFQKMFLVLICSILIYFAVIFYILLIKKLNYNFILSILIAFLISFSAFFSTKNIVTTDYFQTVVSNFLFNNISLLEEKYPNSSDIIELKSYITVGDYEAANSMPRSKFNYINDIFDITLDIKKKNLPELSEMFEKFKKDGYINKYENKILNDYYETKIYVDSKKIPELEYLFIQLNRIDYINDSDIELIRNKYYEILKQSLKEESNII